MKKFATIFFLSDMRQKWLTKSGLVQAMIEFPGERDFVNSFFMNTSSQSIMKHFYFSVKNSSIDLYLHKVITLNGPQVDFVQRFKITKIHLIDANFLFSIYVSLDFLFDAFSLIFIVRIASGWHIFSRAFLVAISHSTESFQRCAHCALIIKRKIFCCRLKQKFLYAICCRCVRYFRKKKILLNVYWTETPNCRPKAKNMDKYFPRVYETFLWFAIINEITIN